MIVGVILAAGKSTRMGCRKASLAVDLRDTYLTRLIRTYAEAGLAETVVVLGHERQAIEAELVQSGLATHVAFNAGYEAGQLSSVLSGLDCAEALDATRECEAVVLGLVDAPFVAAETVRAVIGRYLETGAQVVRPVHAARHGHPVLIDRTLFDLLRRADPQRGAKLVVRAHVSRSGDVDVDDEGAFMDVDTPEDHQRAMRWWSARALEARP